MRREPGCALFTARGAQPGVARGAAGHHADREKEDDEEEVEAHRPGRE